MMTLRFRLVAAFALLMFAALFSSCAVVSTAPMHAPPSEKQVLAFYFPWFGTPSGPSGKWVHWEPQKPRYTSTNTPLSGFYDSLDERTIERHIREARQAGLDGLIASWWGMDSAHHYRFIGVEFSAVPSAKTIYSIVAFGGDQVSDADRPYDLILDRCYVHGHPALTSFRGVLLNSASSAVIDSHVSGIHAEGFDSQAVLGYNGRGPFKIVNNYLEGAAEKIMFGGADPKIRGLVPSDIEIRRNHIFKPRSWRPGDPSFAGVRWTVKNLLELKNAQRVVVEGNLLENNWGGAAVVLTPRNQDGTAPWSVVQDALFRNNNVKNVVGGFSVQTSDELARASRRNGSRS